MSLLTMRTKTVASFPLQDIINGQLAYISARDKLIQQLAAIEVTKEVWDGILSSNYSEATKLEYRKASMNFKKLADTYRDGISKMESQALAFQYKFLGGAGIETSPPNMGLEAPNATATAEVLKAELESRTKAMSFTKTEKDTLNAMHWNIGNQMVNFQDSTGRKMIFFTEEQRNNNAAWIRDVETEARMVAWVRGNFCMPLGVPAVEIPREGVISQFTVFLNRGLGEVFKIRQGTVFGITDLREMKSRLERIFLALQSQNGEFNAQGGVMSYVHRANSTLTWHNQVAANISVMKIIREMINDEIDVVTPDPQGCERVRARYNQKYGSFRDPTFMAAIDRILGGVMSGGALDDATRSLAQAGSSIKVRGELSLAAKRYLRQHPAASPFGGLIDDDVK